MTRLQAQVLVIALSHGGNVHVHHRMAPHGVVRSLRIHGWIITGPDGWRITPEGRAALDAHARASTRERRELDRAINAFRQDAARVRGAIEAGTP
jgi:hypothetical protein